MNGWYNQEEILDITKFGFGVRDLHSDNHWIDAPQDFSFLGKKTILILPGSGTNSAKAANGMCKIAENMLSVDTKNDWQICSMYYSSSRINNVSTAMRAQMMFDQYIIPLISTKDDKGDLHRLSEKEAAENMRNLIIFTHCYGGDIMDAIEKQALAVMKELGYSQQEEALILKQLFVVQHNNIDGNLGKNANKTTQLVRISKADEEIQADDTYYGTFRHYTQINPIENDNIAYIKTNDNQRVLWAKRIVVHGKSEHNGGYWVDKFFKTSAGQKEEDVFSVIFNEITNYDYPIENMEQILKNAAARNPSNNDILKQAFVEGKNFSDEYVKYQCKFYDEFKLLKDKLNENELEKKDILSVDRDVCFMIDNDGNFLMDNLLDNKQYELAITLFHKMAQDAKADYSMFGEGFSFGKDSKNKSDAATKVKHWAQIAINQQQEPLYREIVMSNVRLYDLDYSLADEKTLQTALQYGYTEENYPNDQIDKTKYLRGLISAYKANEGLPASENTQKIRNTIENILFNKIKDSSYVTKACEESGITRLCNLSQSQKSKTAAGDHSIGCMR
ncbi:MAG: hypothetical protein E7017_08050 [Alphaproteobacteria bacterium]|nr:hypothetical protein [Alphaproteobacteria bacterium]